MLSWIAGGVALLFWGLVAFFIGGRFRRGSRQIERNDISKAVAAIYDTPDNIALRMEHEPRNPVPAFKWATIAADDRDWPEAIRRAEITIQRFPKLLQGQQLLTRALWETGQKQRAYQMTRAQLRRYPDDMETLGGVIWQARELGDWRSVRNAARVFRLDHQFVQGFKEEAIAELELGCLKRARKLLEAAELLFPEHEELTQAWERLEAAEQG